MADTIEKAAPGAHTFGPWIADGVRILRHRRSSDRAEISRLVALVYSNEEGSLESNGAVISAAPDMLQALQDLVEQVERGEFDHIGADHPSSAVHAARAAIAKARGPA